MIDLLFSSSSVKIQAKIAKMTRHWMKWRHFHDLRIIFTLWRCVTKNFETLQKIKAGKFSHFRRIMTKFPYLLQRKEKVRQNSKLGKYLNFPREIQVFPRLRQQKEVLITETSYHIWSLLFDIYYKIKYQPNCSPHHRLSMFL